MTDLQTVINDYIKSICVATIQEALPQIIEEKVTNHLSNMDWSSELHDEVRDEVDNQLSQLDLDDKIRDFINDNVTVEISC